MHFCEIYVCYHLCSKRYLLIGTHYVTTVSQDSGTLVPTDRPTELQIPTVNINADYKSGPLDFFFRATIISNYNAWIEFLICFQDQDLMFL